jgi:glycosyltransferase involved in cell wall biosynthesis
MNKLFLSVIIPTYNSGAELPLALIDADKFLRETGFEYEIIVADAKSVDQTADIVRRFSALVKNLKLISCDAANDYGGALRDGVKASSGEICLFVDPVALQSKETFLKIIPEFIDEKNKNCDVIVGKRKLNKNIGFGPRCGFLLARIMARSFLSIKAEDFFSGIWSFRRQCAESVFPKVRLAGNGAGWESVVLADRSSFKVKEIALQENVGRVFSKRVLLENLGPIIKVGYNLRRDNYHLQNKNN